LHTLQACSCGWLLHCKSLLTILLLLLLLLHQVMVSQCC
jgi:hypothetical protein